MEKSRKRTKSRKIEEFGSVSIYIGKEEKEVQNLTLRTSVNEVIQALVKENNPLTDNLSADSQSNGEKDNQSQQSNPSSSSSTQKINEKENWVLVESWRGIERPLPPRTRLLRVWNSWKAEQRFVKFYLKKGASISFRHNQPTKSLRHHHRTVSRKTRPNFIGATETFIDGPFSSVPARLDESTTGGSTTTGSSVTTGTSGTASTTGSSELSVTTTNTTSSSEDDELRRIIELCLEQQEHLVGLESNHENLDICLTQAEGMIRNVELRLETEETLEKIDLIEERISTLNNVKNGLEQDYLNQSELRNSRNATEYNEAEKVRQIQTKIEAQLYLNLQLAHESDQLTSELNDLMDSFEIRHKFLQEQLTELEVENPKSFSHSPDNQSDDVSMNQIHSVSEDSCPDSCPDCAPSHDNHSRALLTSQMKIKRVGGFDSDSSLPDSDSAVSSMSSSDFQPGFEMSQNPVKIPVSQSWQGNTGRETLV